MKLVNKVETSLVEIKQVFKKYEEKDVRISLEKATVNAIAAYGKNKLFNKMNLLVSELRAYYKMNSVSEDAGFLANGLNHLILNYEQYKDFRELEEIFEELIELYTKHNISEIRKEVANSIVTITKYCKEFQLHTKLKKYIPLIFELAEKNNDPELQIGSMKSAFNAITLYAEFENFNKATQILSLAEQMYEETKTKDVFSWLAKIYQNLVTHCIRSNRLEEVAELKLKFQKIFLKNSYNMNVRVEYGRFLFNCLSHFGKSKKFNALNTIKEEIYSLCKGFSNEQILKILAKSSFAVLIYLSQNNRPIYFSDRLMSFNYRHNLPKENGQKKDIKQIEDNFVMDILIQINKIGSNPKELENFIRWISSKISNTIDKFSVKKAVLSKLDEDYSEVVIKSWLLHNI